MTLIRLCKPQTDTDTEALNLRIKELEKNIEALKNDLPKIAAMPTNASYADNEKNEVKDKPETKIIKKAPKEQLVTIKEKWDELLNSMPQPLKSNLEGAEVCYDSSVPNGKLYIVVRSGTVKSFIEADKHTERLKTITDKLYELAGGVVDYAIITDKDSIKGIAAVPKKEEWQSMINMKIDEV